MKKLGIDQHTPVGWREWLTIPEWGVDYIKVKVDTGARTSAIHVENLEEFNKDGHPWVRFQLYPLQKHKGSCISVEVPLFDKREVKSSSGHLEKRPVVSTEVELAGVRFIAEVTLTNRDQMGFRMLLGREALKDRFLVLAGRSYLGGKPPKEVRKKNRRIP